MAMTSPPKLILTISAAILITLTFLLDISDFGQDRVSWESAEITRILLIIAIVAAIGFVLGLFLFRKKKYKQRLFWTVPIAFILFSIAGISMVTITHYGLDEQYNYFTAKRDISNGKVQILQIGLIMPTPNIDKFFDYFKDKQISPLKPDSRGDELRRKAMPNRITTMKDCDAILRLRSGQASSNPDQ